MEEKHIQNENSSKTIAIIGAGPAGNYAAELLARKGFDVHVFEEDAEIGEPWQCTGIVTDAVNKLVNVDEKVIINKISKIRIYSPEEKYIDFNMHGQNIILDRAKFDKSLAEKAKKQGVKFHLNSRFVGFQKKEEKLFLDIAKIKIVKKTNIAKNKKVKKIQTHENFICDYLVGADGPGSSVAKAAGIYGKREFYQGIQARIHLRNENIVETFLDIGAFSWIVPENKNIARVGVITNGNSKRDFDEVISKIKKIKKISNIKIIDRQAGAVPVYNGKIELEKSFGKNKVFLIGDAAVQVKATTFGGIIHGLMAAECLAEAISKNKSYEKLCRKKLTKDLWLSLKIRNTLNKMNAKDYNRLIMLMQKEKTRKVLEKHDRDFPTKFMTKLILAEPRLIGFVRKLI